MNIDRDGKELETPQDVQAQPPDPWFQAALSSPFSFSLDAPVSDGGSAWM
jgi:hypothetical protein